MATPNLPEFTESEREYLGRILVSMYEAIAVTESEGAPAGVVFAAMMTVIPNFQLHHYEWFEKLLLSSDAVTKSGNLLFAVPAKAREIGLTK